MFEVKNINALASETQTAYMSLGQSLRSQKQHPKYKQWNQNSEVIDVCGLWEEISISKVERTQDFFLQWLLTTGQSSSGQQSVIAKEFLRITYTWMLLLCLNISYIHILYKGVW